MPGRQAQRVGGAGDRLLQAAAQAVLVAPGDQREAGRRADRRVGVGLGEADALPGQLVQLRRGEVGLAVDAQVGMAQVVGQDEDDVRLFAAARGGARQRGLAGEGLGQRQRGQGLQDVAAGLVGLFHRRPQIGPRCGTEECRWRRWVGLGMAKAFLVEVVAAPWYSRPGDNLVLIEEDASYHTNSTGKTKPTITNKHMHVNKPTSKEPRYTKLQPPSAGWRIYTQRRPFNPTLLTRAQSPTTEFSSIY